MYNFDNKDQILQTCKYWHLPTEKKPVQSLWLSNSEHNKSINTVVTYVYVQILERSPSPAFLPFLTQEHPNVSALMTLRSHAVQHIPNTSVFLPAADGRHGIVRVDRVPLACKLVDLPCMIESLKTVDKKTFYKTADVCQVNRCPGKDNTYRWLLDIKIIP